MSPKFADLTSLHGRFLSFLAYGLATVLPRLLSCGLRSGRFSQYLLAPPLTSPGGGLCLFVVVLLGLALCSVLHHPAGKAAPDHLLAGSFDMQVIATVPLGPGFQLPCGDADHDGCREFYASPGRPDWPLFVAEHTGNNCFDTFRLTSGSAAAKYLGDADSDGLSDLVILYAAGIAILESPDSASLPSVLVWRESPPDISSSNAIIADLDMDSARAVVWAYPFDQTTVVSENVADNEYRSRRFPWGAPSSLIQTPDLDRDGRPELVLGDYQFVSVCEPVADDSLVRRIRFDVSAWYVDALAAAPDLDHDGLAELVALDGTNVSVIEFPADDSLRVVWTCRVGGSWYDRSVAVGDVDGDSTHELMVGNGDSVFLYRCTGDDQYERFWAGGRGFRVATLYDINSDGRDELLHGIVNTDVTVIRAWLQVGIEERARAALERVTVSPSVARRSEIVRVAGLPASAECEVVDASGRIVARTTSGIWRPASCVAGAYFVRIRVGSQAVVRKVLVVE